MLTKTQLSSIGIIIFKYKYSHLTEYLVHCNYTYEESIIHLAPLPSLITKPIVSFLQHIALQLCNSDNKKMEEERISESALDVFALVAEQEKDHKMLQNVIIFFLQTVLTSFVSSNCHEYTTTCFFFYDNRLCVNWFKEK